MDFGTGSKAFEAIQFGDSDGTVTNIFNDIRSSGRPKNQPSADRATNTADSLPQSVLESWTRIARANMSVRMYNDVVRIASQPAGWRGPGSQPLRAHSLQSFLEFWMQIKDKAVEPELSLSPDGSIHAEWFKTGRQRLDMRFLESRIVFGLFTIGGVLEGAEQSEIVALIMNKHVAQPLRWSAR